MSMKRILTLATAALLVGLVALAAACNQEESDAAPASEDVAADPGQPISVSILAPREGLVVAGPDVEVIVSSSNVEIGEDAARYAIVLDTEVAAGEALAEGDGVVLTTDTRATLTGLEPGQHTITAVVVDSDGRPVEPLSQDSVSIRVK